MATRQRIERLAQRIEGLAEQRIRQRAPAAPEHWMLDHGMARCMKTGEMITEAELEARPCYDGRRIVHVIVDPPAVAPTGETQVAVA